MGEILKEELTASLVITSIDLSTWAQSYQLLLSSALLATSISRLDIVDVFVVLEIEGLAVLLITFEENQICYFLSSYTKTTLFAMSAI